MILDKQNEFSDAQLVTTSAISTNVIDLLQPTGPGLTGSGNINVLKDLGMGEPIWLVAQVDVAFTAAGAATMTISLESDSTANLATSATVHIATAAIPVASLIAGFQALIVRLPAGKTYEQFLGARYTIATGPMTAGSISAFLTKDVQLKQAYSAGYYIG